MGECEFKLRPEENSVISMRKPTVIDLFAGAGGLSEGFREAGFKVILGLDNGKIFMKTFEANHKEAKIVREDIRKVSVNEIKKMIRNKKVDVIVGGPPCQGFSMAGRRDPNDPRNSLFMDFVKFVDGLKPKFFVMENVRGILSMKTAKREMVVKIIENEFNKIGYRAKYRNLMAADYGVPQKRPRVIFIGTNTGKPINFPRITHSKNPYVRLTDEVVERWVPVGSVLLKEDEVDQKFFHSEKMIEGFKNRKKRHLEKGNGFGWQILDPEKPSYTLSARYWKDGADALVKYSEDRIRMLTPLECARIQSFPDTYKFIGSKRDVYTQIGNAVPPLMAKAIADEIKKYL